MTEISVFRWQLVPLSPPAAPTVQELMAQQNEILRQLLQP
jgi:hypothetical protein